MEKNKWWQWVLLGLLLAAAGAMLIAGTILGWSNYDIVAEVHSWFDKKHGKE